MNNDSIILIFIFITHLFLICWAILSFMNSTFLVYNLFFSASLLWSIHEPKSSAPTLVSLLINVMAVVMDAALIGMLWSNRNDYQFIISVLASFVNMLYRLITSLIIYQIWLKRRQNDANVDMRSVSRDMTQYLQFGRSGPVSPPPPNGGIPNA